MQNDLSIFLLSLRFGLAIILYLFLGFSIYILWNNFQKNLNTAAKNPTPKIQLSYNGKIYNFQHNEIFLGRHPNCDLQIDNETVSSNHARIYFDFNQWWVEDSNSSNGSRLNALPLTTPAVLTNEDQIELGNAIITISLE